jgi:hypothetical protein
MRSAFWIKKKTHLGNDTQEVLLNFSKSYLYEGGLGYCSG